MEQAFEIQRKDEEAAKQAEKERLDRERFETLKRKEVDRINEERRKNQKHIPTVTEMQPLATPIVKSASATSYDYDPNRSGDLDDSQMSAVQKSNSIAQMFGDRLRRGSENNIKRAESMKLGPKPAKRTPSFTTRRRASSFRKTQQSEPIPDLPNVEIQAVLERKHELQSGGKKAPVRSWKPYYTVLCGQLLCFFKDSEDFGNRRAATAPVNILNAHCEKADDYTKKKNVFRLKLPDGSEFLFLTGSHDELIDWVNKISFHASLPPNLQLLSYDESVKRQSASSPDIKQSTSGSSVTDGMMVPSSPISSHTSSPDSQKRESRHNSMSSGVSTGSINTPQINFLQKQKELREQQYREKMQNQQLPSPTNGNGGFADKPPIPPRTTTGTPQRQSSMEQVTIRTRISSGKRKLLVLVD